MVFEAGSIVMRPAGELLRRAAVERDVIRSGVTAGASVVG